MTRSFIGTHSLLSTRIQSRFTHLDIPPLGASFLECFSVQLLVDLIPRWFITRYFLKASIRTLRARVRILSASSNALRADVCILRMSIVILRMVANVFRASICFYVFGVFDLVLMRDRIPLGKSKRI